MNAERLKNLQAPVKARYRENPALAQLTLVASGTLDAQNLVCHVDTFNGAVPAGLHEAVGGEGTDACAGDMLLQALVACAGVTLKAVATALAIPIRAGKIRAEGDMDFRGTLGISKEVPAGFQAIRLHFELDTDASAEQVQTLLKLTERYCVVYQTLVKPPVVSTTAGARA